MNFTQAANHFDGRGGYSPRFIVLHGTAGGTTAQGIANYFALPDTEASAHVAIGVAGEAVQCVAYSDGAWSNGALTEGHATFWDEATNYGAVNPNLLTIAIEHCKGSTDNSDLITPAQQATSLALVEELCNTYNIPKRLADATGGITFHSTLDPVNRSRCPGPYPTTALLNYLNRSTAGNNMLQLSDPFGSYFVQNGVSAWKCKQNNIIITGAMLIYFQITMGAPRLPQTPEQYDIKGVVWQKFESGILVYDPQGLLDVPPTAHNHTYMCKTDSALAQRILNGPLQDTLKAAQTAQATAVANLTAANAKILALGKQLSELNTANPTSSAEMKTQLTNANAALTAALALIK